MRKTLFALCCLALLPAFADTIGNVEYHLPTEVSEQWEEGSFQNKQYSGRFYLPQGANSSNLREKGALNITLINTPSDLSTDTFQQDLKKMLPPSSEVNVSVLDQKDDSILYEWSISEESEEKLHGWTRAFSTANQTVVLGYHTSNVTEVPNIRALWLPFLQEAKSITPLE